MNRLTPGYKYSGSGRNRLAANEPAQNKGGILSSIGGYLKGSFEKQTKGLYEDAQLLSEDIRRQKAGLPRTPEALEASKREQKRITNIALGFGPAPLKDLSRRALQATGLKEETLFLEFFLRWAGNFPYWLFSD